MVEGDQARTTANHPKGDFAATLITMQTPTREEPLCNPYNGKE